jgi:hypothetical protein
MRKISFGKGFFNAFSGLHEGLVLLKDLPKPSMPNRTYMRKIIFEKYVCNLRVQRLMDLHGV